MIDSTTLALTEPHPSAREALDYIRTIPQGELMQLMESLASCAIENNRLAEVCVGTLDRLMSGMPVSDRYVLGLAWTIKGIREEGPHERN